MILTASSADALATRKRDEAGRCRFYRTSLVGSDAGAHGVVAALAQVPAESQTHYPVAYQIELDPYSDLDVHFHRANQFQVFVRGSGTLGRHPVQAAMVHYAGAHTAYGPIRPGAQGVSFITLRDAWDPGARFLPQHKDELRLARAVRREALTRLLEPADAAHLLQRQQVGIEVLLASDDDAMRVWSLRLPPGALVDGPARMLGGGRFWLVLAGAMTGVAGQHLPPLSCVFVAAHEPAAQVRAAATGLHLLVMQFPSRRAQPDLRARAGSL